MSMEITTLCEVLEGMGNGGGERVVATSHHFQKPLRPA